jgi:hypothetical protein
MWMNVQLLRVTPMESVKIQMAAFSVYAILDMLEMDLPVQHKQWCTVYLYLQLFVGGLMFYLRYLCLLANNGNATHIELCS